MHRRPFIDGNCLYTWMVSVSDHTFYKHAYLHIFIR